MVKREEVEEMLIGCGEPPLNTKDDLCLVPATTLAELARTWLAVDGAPVGVVDSFVGGRWWVDKCDMAHFTTLKGQRVKLVLVPEADSGGDSP